MSSFLDSIKRKVQNKGWKGCQTKKCSKGKCELKSNRSDRVLILDMDCKALNYSPQNKRKCDFVVFGEKGQFVAVEMKSGTLKSTEIKQQIEASADFMVDHLSLQEEPRIQFRAWLVHQGVPSIEARRLKKFQISVSGLGHRCKIQLIRSNRPLSEALNKNSPA